ncbi:tRNA (adenosine(37)-N6)-threonylcarbamoyltransferase complex dimerization subunit type 1 TsaB [Ferrimonas lipolytica]|uniref:tRNA threonylcarbamoyladenosine biosynthesis protein TsaB n=1 Tax=Ferrimonas lipolytica TaxID=2724191 RepID=A0A6H1UCC1_9GAMM|nr:tRNA (adenosine(37)-N6)-threonylcarbamoyltransferase complex dimerization subunit type 1 TsaB [Ferrimonas lipolytica]QIZ76747.1 tRNA (adenosine(37)-N6)-threonylcarbamoyltransferase complex dimerization subunit type 1 TsaB [Ferrimonas lipolytica]
MSDTILILDTATENCSAALYHNGQVFEDCAEAPREHSQRILPMVESLLSQAQISLDDAAVIAFGCGPGSFTGIRIGTAMVQGLALGAELPVLPLSNLAAMAQGAINAGATEVVAAIDARMGEVYFGHYRAEEGLAVLQGQEVVIKPDTLQPQLDAIGQATTAVGTGFETYPQLIANQHIEADTSCRLPSAAMMMPLAQHGWRTDAAISIDDVEPVYLRNEVTWKKLPGRE